MFSKIFIDRPILATVISLVIVLIGSISIPLLPVEKTPDITPPTVVVRAMYPGANAEVIADTVATPLEEQINGVEGMINMKSKSSDDGSMELTISFEVGTDIDIATVMVQNRVAMAEPLLPEEVKRQGIVTNKESSNITMFLAMTSSNPDHDEIYLSNYTKIKVKDTLARVKGVGNVIVFGAKDFGMRVWLDPDSLKAKGITSGDIINAIREQNIQVAAGQLGASPSPKGQQFQYTIKTLGRLSTVEEFENIIIKTGDQGRLLRIKDVARIELGSQQYNSYVQLNGISCVGIGIFQLPGANAMAVAEGIRSEMDRLKVGFPEGMDYMVGYDPTLFISESIREVLITLLIAVALVILTVYIFLQDLRTTLIPAVTIPVSLIGTFAVMMIFGMSINTLTMFGLVLAIGIVVDDAIIVVENTMRIIDDEKLPAKLATEKAMKQITGPVIATTLVLLSVFIPTAMIGGITGKLYQQFAMTISIATVFSSINALTLSPALCGLFLRPSPAQHRGLFKWFNRFMDYSTTGYIGVVKGLLRHASIGLVLLAIVVGLTMFGFKITPTGFLPLEDEGFVFMNVSLPEGATLERTSDVTDDINDILAGTDGVQNSFAVGGVSFMEGTNSSNVATFFVSLDPWSERTDPSLGINNIIMTIQMQLASILDAQCMAVAPPPIMGLAFADGFEVQIQDQGGAGIKTLDKTGKEMMFAAMENPKIMWASSTFKANVPQLYLDIDRVKAKTIKVPLSSIFETLQSNLGSYYINDFNIFGRTYRVIAQADKDFRSQVEDIERLEVRNEDGKMVPLGTLLTVEDTAGPQTISHYNMYPATTLMGGAAPGFSSGEAIQEIKQLCDNNLPSTMGYEWSGMSFQEIMAGNKTPIIFTLASIFVFLFLAAQYESWSIPISIVLTVPLAIFGALLFTMLRAYDNNIYTQIGLVLLIGLASKTAILLVEFAKKHHEEGHSVYESAVEASRLRFRPILMTAFSFILGVVPLVVATGAGSASRRVMGTAVFGGMLIATLMGIFLIPVFYLIIQKISDKFAGKKGVQD